MALLLFGVAIAASAAAQNHVVNGRLDVDTSPWFATTGAAIARSPIDVNGWSHSGSLQVTSLVSQANQAVAAEQCANASPGMVHVRANYLIPSGQSSSGFVYVFVQPNSGDNCHGSGLSTLNGAFETHLGQWTRTESDVTLPSGTASVLIGLAVAKTVAGGQLVAHFDDIFLGTPCHQSSTNLCVSGNRFGIQAAWQTIPGDTGAGTPIPLTSDTGYFWFFGPSNVEAVIKVLDACPFFDRFWVFAGGLTDVKVDLTVTDFETNTVKTYTNPLGKPFQPIQDTNAFATCP